MASQTIVRRDCWFMINTILNMWFESHCFMICDIPLCDLLGDQERKTDRWEADSVPEVAHVDS